MSQLAAFNQAIGHLWTKIKELQSEGTRSSLEKDKLKLILPALGQVDSATTSTAMMEKYEEYGRVRKLWTDKVDTVLKFEKNQTVKTEWTNFKNKLNQLDIAYALEIQKAAQNESNPSSQQPQNPPPPQGLKKQVEQKTGPTIGNQKPISPRGVDPQSPQNPLPPTGLQKQMQGKTGPTSEPKKQEIQTPSPKVKINQPGSENNTIQEPEKKKQIAPGHELRLREAVQVVQKMRVAELKAQVSLREEMTRRHETLSKIRGTAEQLATAAEQDAMKGLPKNAQEKSLKVGEMASSADQSTKESSKYLTTKQNEFLKFRNGLNWAAAAKQFDLAVDPQKPNGNVEKANFSMYGKVLAKFQPIYSNCILEGAKAIETRNSMEQMVKEIKAIGELCAAYGKTATELRQHVLDDLTNVNGTTSRANFEQAIKRDQKNVDDLYGKLKLNIDGLGKDVDIFATLKTEEEKHHKTEQIHIRWNALTSTTEEFNAVFGRAQQAVDSARKRIPKSLSEDKEITKALDWMDRELKGRELFKQVVVQELPGVKEKLINHKLISE